MAEVQYDGRHAYVDGFKFLKDKKTGYYLSTSKIGNVRPRLHVYMWQKYNGDIPKGYEVNHIDENKDNNEISNLMLMSKHDHLKWHYEHDKERLIPIWRGNLDKARIKASEWHKSEEGRKQTAKIKKGKKIPKKYVKRCSVCGKVYRAAFARSKFCSPNCQTKGRKMSGKDNVKSQCEFCGKDIWSSKYQKKKCCSKKCYSKLKLQKSKSNRGTTQLQSGKFIGQFGYLGKKHHTRSYLLEKQAYDERQKMIDEILKA